MRFNFSTCVPESEFWARSIWAHYRYPFRIKNAIKTHARTWQCCQISRYFLFIVISRYFLMMIYIAFMIYRDIKCSSLIPRDLFDNLGPYFGRQESLFVLFGSLFQCSGVLIKRVTPVHSIVFVMSAHAFFAFLGHFWFWMGICNVPRWNGLGILIPKHMWKIKIGPLEQI